MVSSGYFSGEINIVGYPGVATGAPTGTPTGTNINGGKPPTGGLLGATIGGMTGSSGV